MFGKADMGMRNDRASLTPTSVAFASASAALRSGFFSSTRLAACCKERSEGFGGTCANIIPAAQKTSATSGGRYFIEIF